MVRCLLSARILIWLCNSLIPGGAKQAVGAQDATTVEAFHIGGGLDRRRPGPLENANKGRRRLTTAAKRAGQHLLAGALAGATAKTIEAPLDRVKIIFQVNKERFSLRAAVRRMLEISRNEGVRGLWKGNGAPACGAPASWPAFCTEKLHVLT